MPRARRATAPVEPSEDLDPLRDLDLPKDPVPRRGRASTTRRSRSTGETTATTRTTAAMRATVQSELHMGFELLAASWAAAGDPCAEVAFEVVRVPTARGVVEMDRLEALAQRVTNVIARYPRALKRMSQGGVIMDYLMIGSLLWPIGRTVAIHHGPGGQGHAEREPEDLSAYAAHRAG